MSHSHTPPRPHLALRVGITGHCLNRLLEAGVDIEGVWAQLRIVLTGIQRATQAVKHDFALVYTGQPILYLVSPLAEGADQIAADAALALGYKLHVPLPCLARKYTGGFQRPTRPVAEDPVAAFNRLIRLAESVQVLDGSETAVLDGAAYAAVGRAVLRHSDILIAVWEGADAAGAGGTGEVVAQARRWEVPTVVIDPTAPANWRVEDRSTGSTHPNLAEVVRRVLAPPAPGQGEEEEAPLPRISSDGEVVDSGGPRVTPTGKIAPAAAIAPGLIGYLHTHIAWGIGGFFNSAVALTAWEWPLKVGIIRLGRVCVQRSRAAWDAIWSEPTRLDPEIVHPITHLLRDYYAWADGLADRFGTLHRDLSTAPYLLALVAVFGTTLAERTESPCTKVIVASLTVFVALFTVAVYYANVHGRYHGRWIDYRSLAEELRHLAFLWPLGRPLRTAHITGEPESEASRFAWVGWYARAVARQGGLYPGVLTPDRLTAWRTILIERYMEPQCEYHQRTGDRFHRVQHRLHSWALGLFIAACALSVVNLVLILRDPSLLTASGLRATSWWAAAALAVAALFPAIASSLHAFLSQGDFWNLSRRSTRMCQQLTKLIDTVPQAPPTIEELGNVAEDASDVMRDEVLNWRVFVRLKPPVLG